jgi:hypothetical protein
VFAHILCVGRFKLDFLADYTLRVAEIRLVVSSHREDALWCECVGVCASATSLASNARVTPQEKKYQPCCSLLVSRDAYDDDA